MSKQRRVGTAFEREVADYLEPVFPSVQRTGSARQGEGDLEGTGEFVFEVKRHRELRLSSWLKQVRLAAEKVGARFPVVIAKRRQHNVAGSYVVMELQDFRRMLAELMWMESDAWLEIDDDDAA